MSFGLTIKNICSSTTLSVNAIGCPILVSQNAMKFNTNAPLTCTSYPVPIQYLFIVVAPLPLESGKGCITQEINQVKSSQKQSDIHKNGQSFLHFRLCFSYIFQIEKTETLTHQGDSHYICTLGNL